MATGLQDYFSRVFSEMLLGFTDLQDTPGSYVGEANKNVRVNEAESGLEFGGAYFDGGLDAAKGEAGRIGRVWWATDSKILYWDDGTNWVEILRAEAVSRLASLVEHSHASLSNVSEDQHHPHEHHADHENGGDHEISVAGLSGLLADPQTPIGGLIGEGHITILPWANYAIVQGTWAILADAGQVMAAVIYNTTSADGDEITFKAFFAAGTYTMKLLYVSYDNRGIAEILIDGVSIGTKNQYAVVSVKNLTWTVTGIVIAAAGLKTISFKVNGSANAHVGYYIVASSISFFRTA